MCGRRESYREYAIDTSCGEDVCSLDSTKVFDADSDLLSDTKYCEDSDRHHAKDRSVGDLCNSDDECFYHAVCGEEGICVKGD